MKKRVISFLMAICMIITMLPTTAFAVEENTNATVDTGNVSIEGTNSFGTLLSEDLNEELAASESAAEDYSAGYTVIGLTIEGNAATVEYSSLEDAIAVVSLYTEDGQQMLVSSTAVATADATEVVVTLEGDLPEYFMASAYLLDNYDYSPLCPAYDTPMYTQEMQELLASTVEDYEEDRVLNLDEDNTTNFAVYADETIVVEYVDGVNTVASADDENAIYVIENADEQITGLQAGQVFVYSYGEYDILIVKVDTITVDGTTATITGASVELEEVFSHVKIEGSGSTSDIEVDETTGVDGITYLGLVEDPGQEPDEASAYRRTSKAIEGDVSLNATLSYKIDKDFFPDGEISKVKIEGSLGIKIGPEISYYKSATRLFLEAKIPADITITVKAESSVKFISIPLLEMGFWPTMGVHVAFKPEIQLKFTGALSWTGKIHNVVGFSWEKGVGTQSLTTHPKVDSKVDFEGTLFFGIDFCPTIDLINEKFLTAKFSALVGVEIEGKMSGQDAEADEIFFGDEITIRHECRTCVAFDFYVKLESSLSITLLNNKNLTLKVTFGGHVFKIREAYYSQSMDEFGWGSCPYKSYRVVVVVPAADGGYAPSTEVFSRASGAAEATSMGCTSGGLIAGYFPADLYTFTGVVDGTELGTTLRVTEPTKVILGQTGTDFSFLDGAASPEDLEASKVIASGTCGADGDNITWTLHNNGRLVLKGAGKMADYTYRNMPWGSYLRNIEKVIIGNGITSIGNYNFFDCSMNSVSIPDSVTSIGNSAFYSCVNLTEVAIPNSVTFIGELAFSNCLYLTSIDIPDSIITIESNVFSHCTRLESVSIPHSVTSIKNDAFAYCTSLTDVVIPDSVTSIGNLAFYDCTSLKSIIIPNSVTSIGGGAFEMCTSLSSVKLSDSITSIPTSMFRDCISLTSVEIPGRVTSIGSYAFCECNGLTSVTIPDSVRVIEVSAFAACPYLAGNPIGTGVEIIQSSAFNSCTSLTNVIIPDSITEIGSDAFSYCSSLQKVTIGKEIKTIGTRAFQYCNNLDTVIFRGKAPTSAGNCFASVKLTVYYPQDHSSWPTSWNTGGSVTWVPYTLDENGEMILGEATAVAAAADVEATAMPAEEPAQQNSEAALTGAVSGTQNGASLYSIYDGEYETETVEERTLWTATFKDLVPDEEYVLLALASLEVEDPLAADNLLFIDQAPAAEDGTLVFRYIQREETDVSYVMACGASHKDLADAKITFPCMSAGEERLEVKPTVTYDGKVLQEGKDYILAGAVDYAAEGEYTCYVRGIRAYTGLVKCGYSVLAEGGHEEIILPAVEPTCTETGLTEGKKCLCGEILVAQETVPALGHTEEALPAVEATCTAAGLTAGVKCSVCGEVLTQQEVIPALGHSYADGTCQNCGEAEPVSITVETAGSIPCTVDGNTITVTHDAACKVGYLVDGAYVKVSGTENADGSYSFEVPEGVTSVLVVVAGDVSGDGKLLAIDKTRLNAALLKKTTLDAKASFAADVSGDGKLLAIDKTRLNAALLKKTTLTW